MEGVKFARNILSQPIARNTARGEVWPGPAVDTDAEIAQHVKDNAWGHHASCTSKMGPASDSTAVVDSQFRVHGIQNLRVVDASVFPKIPGLFIVVPTYMISEKAADAILRA